MNKLEFKIHRNIDQYDPEGVEYWVYEEVTKAEKRDNYIVIIMRDRSAIIPLNWVLEVREL